MLEVSYLQGHSFPLQPYDIPNYYHKHNVFIGLLQLSAEMQLDEKKQLHG